MSLKNLLLDLDYSYANKTTTAKGLPTYINNSGLTRTSQKENVLTCGVILRFAEHFDRLKKASCYF